MNCIAIVTLSNLAIGDFGRKLYLPTLLLNAIYNTAKQAGIKRKMQKSSDKNQRKK